MAEQYLNIAKTSVSNGGSGYISGATSLKVVSTTNGSITGYTGAFPTSGTFSVVIVDAATEQTIKAQLEVTAVTNSTTWAVASEIAGNANDGDTVIACWWSTRAISQIRADQSQVGVYASLPGSGMKQGDRYNSSDVEVQFVYDGSNWQPFKVSPMGAYGTPTSLPGLYIWCAADKITGLADGDSVANWPNLVAGPYVTGGGSNAVALPVYKTSIVNSLAVVRGAGSAALSAVMPEIIGARAVSIFLVINPSSLAPAYSGLVNSNSGGFGWYVKSNGKTAFYNNATNYDGSGGVTLSINNWYIMSLLMNPGVTNVFVTRVALANDFTSTSTSFLNTGTSGNASLGCIGTDGQIASRVFSGDIAEIVMYRRALSSTERDTIESYLKTKYGL